MFAYDWSSFRYLVRLEIENSITVWLGMRLYLHFKYGIKGCYCHSYSIPVVAEKLQYSYIRVVLSLKSHGQFFALSWLPEPLLPSWSAYMSLDLTWLAPVASCAVLQPFFVAAYKFNTFLTNFSGLLVLIDVVGAEVFQFAVVIIDSATRSALENRYFVIYTGFSYHCGTWL